MDYKELIHKIDKANLPKHIGIIMDGNGRWAKIRGLDRIEGHKAGRDTVREMVEIGTEIGIDYMTVYAFSTENWKRPDREVKTLFSLFTDSLRDEIEELNKNNVNLRIIGSHSRLQQVFIDNFNKVSSITWNNDGLHFNVALNYGGRNEIIEAVNSIIKDISKGKLKKKITEEILSNYLYTANMPDPDLIIRTSGEQRLSNFFVWQSAYSEFWFTDILWPDFNKADFLKAIIDFQNRKRRFGKVK